MARLILKPKNGNVLLVYITVFNFNFDNPTEKIVK